MCRRNVSTHTTDITSASATPPKNAGRAAAREQSAAGQRAQDAAEPSRAGCESDARRAALGRKHVRGDEIETGLQRVDAEARGRDDRERRDGLGAASAPIVTAASAMSDNTATLATAASGSSEPMREISHALSNAPTDAREVEHQRAAHGLIERKVQRRSAPRAPS